MKIWVIGAFGMLGSSVSSCLSEHKIDFLKSFKKDADITELESLRSFAKDKEITHIINCAAYTKVDLAEKEEELAIRINVRGPENLGMVAKEISAKVMHFSTDYVFDGQTSHPYLETDSAAPLNTYGRTKWEGEQGLLKVFPDACIIRTSWLFGLNGPNFISKMIHLMQQKKEIQVASDQIGKPTFCGDLAQAAIELLDSSGIYHFANYQTASWYDLTRTIYDEAKKRGFDINCEKIIPITTDQFPSVAKRPQYSVLDTTKIETLLGKSPRPWEDAVKDYIHQYFQSICQ